MPHIFLDESGQFARRAYEKYFVVGSFTVGNPRRTKKNSFDPGRDQGFFENSAINKR